MTLVITRVVKNKLDGSSAQTCFCKVLAVDGMNLPDRTANEEFCLKFFDDRLLPDNDPEDDWDSEPDYENFLFSEDLVRREDAVYRKLEHVQGSVIAHYYGCHEVRASSLPERLIPELCFSDHASGRLGCLRHTHGAHPWRTIRLAISCHLQPLQRRAGISGTQS